MEIVQGAHFTGEQFDSGLGNYYLRARYYDPSNGSFTALDLFPGNYSNPQSLHKYAYCHTDPLNAIDPSGLMTLSEVKATMSTYLKVAASILLPTYTVKSYLIRMVIGAAFAAGIMTYATWYLPPTLGELEKLAISFESHGDFIHAYATRVMVKEGNELYFDIMLNQVMKLYLFGQFGLAINGYLGYKEVQQITGFVNTTNLYLMSIAGELDWTHAPQIDRNKAFKLMLAFEATPEQDTRLFRLCYEARKRGDIMLYCFYSTLLMNSVQKYGYFVPVKELENPIKNLKSIP